MFIKFKLLDGEHIYIHTEGVVTIIEHSPKSAIIECVTGKRYYVSESAEDAVERIFEGR